MGSQNLKSNINISIDLKKSIDMSNIGTGDARSIQKQLYDAALKFGVSVDVRVGYATSVIKLIANDGNLDQAQKIDGIKAIYNDAFEALQKMVAMPPLAVAPKLWQDRTKHRSSPYDFVKEHYPNYGRGLCMADIRKLDRKLYTALQNYALRYGKPDNFDVPLKTTRIDALTEIFALSGAITQHNSPTAQALAKAIRQKKPAP